MTTSLSPRGSSVDGVGGARVGGGAVARSLVPMPRPSHQEEAARGGCRAPARGRRAGAPRGPQRDERRSRGFALRRAHAHQHQALSLSVNPLLCLYGLMFGGR